MIPSINNAFLEIFEPKSCHPKARRLQECKTLSMQLEIRENGSTNSTIFIKNLDMQYKRCPILPIHHGVKDSNTIYNLLICKYKPNIKAAQTQK